VRLPEIRINRKRQDTSQGVLIDPSIAQPPQSLLLLSSLLFTDRVDEIYEIYVTLHLPDYVHRTTKSAQPTEEVVYDSG